MRQTIEWAAKRYTLTPEIVAAVILQESEGYQFAFRQERGFVRRHGLLTRTQGDLLGHWPERTSDPKWDAYERQMRGCSFGYMQVMGQTARELFFLGEDLWELVDPAINIELGCKRLRYGMRLAMEKGSANPINDMLLSYNGGGNPKYDDEVLHRITNGTAANYLDSLHA